MLRYLMLRALLRSAPWYVRWIAYTSILGWPLAGCTPTLEEIRQEVERSGTPVPVETAQEDPAGPVTMDALLERAMQAGYQQSLAWEATGQFLRQDSLLAVLPVGTAIRTEIRPSTIEGRASLPYVLLYAERDPEYFCYFPLDRSNISIAPRAGAAAPVVPDYDISCVADPPQFLGM